MTTKKKIVPKKKIVAKKVPPQPEPKAPAKIIATATVLPPIPAAVVLPHWRKAHGDATWHSDPACVVWPIKDYSERTERPTSNLCPLCKET